MSAAVDLRAHPAGAVGWISTAELARLLGKTSPRAARDWLARHGIRCRRDGKYNWVRVEDVRRAIEALPVDPGGAARPGDRRAAIEAGLAALGG